MAQFICERCGHHEVLPDDCLHRLAYCPECRNVGRVREDCSRPDASPAKRDVSAGAWRAALFCCICEFVAVLGAWVFLSDWRSDRHPDAAGRLPVSTSGNQVDSDKLQDTSPIAKAVASADRELNWQREIAATINDREDRSRRAEASGIVARNHALERIVEADPIAPKTVVVETPPQPEQVVEKAVSAVTKLATVCPKEVSEGQRLFEHEWTEHDPLAGGGDGLGPEFNARSCAECHHMGGSGGSGTNQHNVQTFEILPDKHGGHVWSGVIHAASTDPALTESKSSLESLLGSPKVPFQRIDSRKNNGIVEVDAIRTVFINTPALWGNGIIDKITERDLQKLDYSHPTTGRFRHLVGGKIGKFGWKAQIASLHQFVGSACAGEVGLSNSIRCQQKPLEFRDNVIARHDLTDDQLKALVKYVADLPAPTQVMPEDAAGRNQVAAGGRLFSAIGCANCHVPNVGPAHGVYSDFRLHNISSASTRVETYYVVNAVPIFMPAANYPRLSEWKTPPLWGLADTAPYWHDGSAATIREAILKHEGEANVVKAEFEILDLERQQELFAFLDSLKAPILQK